MRSRRQTPKVAAIKAVPVRQRTRFRKYANICASLVSVGMMLVQIIQSGLRSGYASGCSARAASQKLANLPISTSTASTKTATIGWAGVAAAASGVAAARASAAGVVATATAQRAEASAATNHCSTNRSHQ